MARLLAFCMLLSATVVSAQPRRPSFMDAMPLDATLETPHLQAQARGPVRIGADGRGTMTVVVTPRPRMHVYAADVEGYAPFSLKLEGPASLTPGKVTYPAAETYVFPPTGETSRVYMRPFEVTQAVTLTADGRKALAPGARVNGVATLRYQACDDTVCYRVTTGAFVVEIIR
jgi:hypothetical protein